MEWNPQLGCQELVYAIVREIETSQRKAISFADYMQHCLYHPEYGYYMRSTPKIGKEGDFYTSSSIGSLMGEVLLQYIMSLISRDDSLAGQPLILVEWGGGTGRFARQILDEMSKSHPSAYEKVQYVVIEQSPAHIEVQQETLTQHGKQVRFMSEDEWFSVAEMTGVIVFSNELLDAFPAQRFVSHDGLIEEIYVAWDAEQGRFVERLFEVEEPIVQYIDREQIRLYDGQRFEINLLASRWIQSIGRHLHSGHLITIDYGDIAAEIYAEHRMQGTLMCYRKHQASDDPYIYIGQQDICTHVNFSALVHAGLDVGFNQWTLQTQKTFLVENGILDQLQNHSSTDYFHPIARKNRAIRQILLSDQMSELFKVLVQTKKGTRE